MYPEEPVEHKQSSGWCYERPWQPCDIILMLKSPICYAMKCLENVDIENECLVIYAAMRHNYEVW